MMGLLMGAESSTDEMPKLATPLSARKVETLKAPGLYADGNNLYLQVLPSGAKTWIFRYLLGGKRRDMGLGPATVVTLADARRKAIEARNQVLAGVDPIEAKRRAVATAALDAATAMSFQQAAEAYIEAMRPGWKSAVHSAQWASTLDRYAHPIMGALPVAGIDTGLVVKVLEPIWSTKTETASRVRGRIEAILDWAKVRGFRAGENPARWKGHLDHILPAKGAVAKVEHHRALPYSEMPDFWIKLRQQDGGGARAMELLILTAARSGEVLGARWDEIDMEAATWTIPGGRMKGGAEHRIPLSDPALALLRTAAETRQGALVFPGQRADRSLSNMVMTVLLRRMKIDATAHGFRSSFRTWIGETTNYPHEVAEAALAHAQPDAVVAAYSRGDFFGKRRAMMEAWARFVTGSGRAKVVKMAAGG